MYAHTKHVFACVYVCVGVGTFLAFGNFFTTFALESIPIPTPTLEMGSTREKMIAIIGTQLIYCLFVAIAYEYCLFLGGQEAKAGVSACPGPQKATAALRAASRAFGVEPAVAIARGLHRLCRQGTTRNQL